MRSGRDAAFGLTGSVAHATSGPGAAGAEYLTLPIGAKSIAMGEVQSAAIGEPLGWLSNPATLHCMDGLGFGVFHTEWLMQTQYDNVAVHSRVNDQVSLAAGFVSLRRPEIQGYDEFGRETGVLDNTNYQALVGLAYSPVPSFAAGLTVKYFNEKLDDVSAGGVGFDIGALYAITSAKLSLGFVAQNLGSDIAFESVEEPLPTTLRGGASYSRRYARVRQRRPSPSTLSNPGTRSSTRAQGPSSCCSTRLLRGSDTTDRNPDPEAA